MPSCRVNLRIVRNFAKLVLFFSLNFFIIFAASAVFRFLAVWVDWVKYLPAKPETAVSMITSAAHWALSLSLFTSIIITLNYAIRRNYYVLMAVPCVMLLSFFICFAITLGLEHLRSLQSAPGQTVSIDDNGLILSNTLSGNETAVVLLGGTDGPRIAAVPNQPLLYLQNPVAGTELPPIPFGDDTPWFLKSLAIDIRLNAESLQRKFNEGFFPYLFYSGSLVFMLCSLGYAVKFSVWPLANLFLAALAFRGILSLETFLSSAEMRELLSSFMYPALASASVPLFFLGFGILLNLYTLLVYAAKRRDDDED